MEIRRILLDTSAYSGFMLGRPTLRSAIQSAEEIFLSPIVLGELLSGFRSGRHRVKNENELRTFLSSPRVSALAVTNETAQRYAVIHETLKTAGTPIPTHDLWIAATAMEHGLILLTSDHHFTQVPQIMKEILPASVEAARGVNAES